ncbi:hypothetical protein GCM10027612_14940 [Microbispora bryophytorum subsp. camponoti]
MGTLYKVLLDSNSAQAICAETHDYRRMSELLSAYTSLRLQAVGACVTALAERFHLRGWAAEARG